MSKCVFDTILYIYDGISKMLDNRNYSNRVVIDKTIKITLILIVLFVMFLILHSNSKIQYLDILPSTSIFHTKPKYLKEIFKSRQLYIRESNLTKEYLRYIRPVVEKEDIKSKTKNIGLKFDESYFEKRIDQLGFAEYGRLCTQEELLSPGKITLSSRPYISIIIPSFNKEKNLVKSIRSIQNQSLKNIEIIIVDDGSTDNSQKIYKYLLETDPRIRIFYHLNNMGIWRTSIDGFLYSRAKYYIYFDAEDFYTDNYVLEDAYNIIEKYELDSVRFSFLRSSNILNPYSRIDYEMKFPEKFTKIIYGTREFDLLTCDYGAVWNRVTKANIFTKGLHLLDNYLLNAHKNLWEDRWINYLVNKMSFNYLMINRPGYLYFFKSNGEGKLKFGDSNKKFKIICEFINFWIFDLKMLPKEDNKKCVINNLRQFNSTNNRYFGIPVSLNYLNKKYIPYENLLNSLINDTFLLNEDKIFVNNLYNEYKIKNFN